MTIDPDLSSWKLSAETPLAVWLLETTMALLLGKLDGTAGRFARTLPFRLFWNCAAVACSTVLVGFLYVAKDSMRL